MIRLPVALASLLLGKEHALVTEAATQYPGGCTLAEIMTLTKLDMSRVTFILWDLTNAGIGNFSCPIFTLTEVSMLEEAIKGISSAEERRRFDCALKGTATSVAA